MSVAPGFADATRDAQRAFRAILTAMSRPGRIVDAGVPAPPDGLSPAAAAVLLTLCDGETPVWLDDATSSAGSWLRFHCGVPLTAETQQSRFAMIGDPGMLPPLERFAVGSDEYPDRSTTLIVEVAFTGGAKLRVSGPGIADRVSLAIGGLGASFWEERADLAPLFPCGLDLILTCGSRLIALPRTVRVDF
jgi:alpha-D-ribose 1-methylphosphonate 5-triphosphate synthase subunit PhnH